jgi:hypothetical protein
MRVLLRPLVLAGLFVAAGCAGHPPTTPGPGNAGAGAAGAPGPAPARADSASGFSYTLEGLDRNGDRKVSKEEFRVALERKFKELDKDGSGKIDVKLECLERASHHCQHADKSGDGQVDLAEFIAHGQAEFDRADTNKDGFLAPEEISALQIFGW